MMEERSEGPAPQDEKREEDPLLGLYADLEQAGVPSETSAKGEAKQRQSHRPAYRSGLGESRTTRRQTARATGKNASVAGRYLRRSFTYRPDQLEQIESWAGRLGLSQNDLVRWFTDMGVAAVAQGQRPPLAEEVRRKYDPGAG